MEFICKKTTDLTDIELQEITSLFEVVMKRNRSVDIMRNQYTNNTLGTSFHVMMKDNGVLVGHNAGVPGYYKVNGKIISFLNNVDMMISKDHRGIQNFFGLMKEAYKFYKEEGIAVVYSIPNNNSHPLLTKMKFTKDISSLYTYCLPYRIGGVKVSLKWANSISQLLCKVWLKCNSLLASKKQAKFNVQKDLDSFNRYRYKRMDGKYSFAENKGSVFVYKVMEYEETRTAFLIDVLEKSAKNFCNAVDYILKNESEKFDILLYVGYLPFSHHGMVRIPHKHEPKNFNFVAHIIDDSLLDTKDQEDMFNIKSWDINLSDNDII